ncbi:MULTISPECIES: VWA domain-containing protein [unclassified Anaeromyxobacter]|uniref:vWA domain-containing protein n=1 Tax=unclassified Anaeromyxobacter TaxID=2620896 RepID=UPI001F581A08|nr:MULTISPECIES: VWA domain-containing protein [unclassified Anaeromyxobacter]
MKRLLFDVSRWHLMLHREHRQLPRAQERDVPQLRLEDELFERLYTGEGERLAPSRVNAALRPWAERVHSTCDALPSFARLSAECRGDAAASAAAVEAIVRELNLPPPDEPPPPAAPGVGKDPLRRPLAAACAAATRAVAELRDAAEGLAHVAFQGGLLPGTGTADGVPREHGVVRSLAARLKGDERLRRIAALAGRFKRIAAAKRRQRVRHGADEVTDVEQGADLGRALPVELAKLSHRLLRLDFLRALLESRSLQYRLEGTATLGKGPLVVLLDKSGSMDGPRDVWATAVALALLDQAQRERRTFALLGFDARVKFEAVVKPSEALPDDGLFVSCAGGTEIAAAVGRGLEIIRTHPGALRKADLVLVTDGGSDASTAGALRESAAALGVTILGLGIGVEREWLVPWCDEVHAVTDLSTVDDSSASALFAA